MAHEMPDPMEAASLSHPTLSPREVRRNFACLVWMGSVFAMGWAEVVVVLQPLLVHYGATNTQIGIVQGVLIATLPGMFLSPWITRRFRHKKVYLFVTDSLYLLPVGLVGAAVWAGGVGGNAAMVAFIVWMMLAGQIAAGFGGLPNQEFFTACIPMRLRGRLAGVSAGLGGLLGLGAAGFAAWLLGVMPKPQAYGVLLVLAWLLCQLADAAVLLAREPPTPVEASPTPVGQGNVAGVLARPEIPAGGAGGQLDQPVAWPVGGVFQCVRVPRAGFQGADGRVARHDGGRRAAGAQSGGRLADGCLGRAAGVVVVGGAGGRRVFAVSRGCLRPPASLWRPASRRWRAAGFPAR